MEIISDLEIHSRFARACSTQINIENLEKYARIKGINLLKVKDFTKEVWNGPEFSSFRDKLLSNKRSCPLWDLEIK